MYELWCPTTSYPTVLSVRFSEAHFFSSSRKVQKYIFLLPRANSSFKVLGSVLGLLLGFSSHEVAETMHLALN